NHMSEELTGWSETAVIGKPIEKIFNIINEETRNIVENPVHKVLKEGVVVGLANHTLLISRDGKEIPIADSGAPIRDELGKIEGVVLVFRDKTVEYKFEKLIRQSEARLKRAELTSKSGNWELHLDSQVIIASEGAAKIYGVDWNKIEFEIVKKVALPEYRQLLDLALKNLIEKNEPYNIEFKIRTVDTGEIKDIHSVANYDSRNRILFGVIQDITDRKKAETALIESEEKMRMIIEGTPYFFFYTQDSEANITYISPSVETITGYSVDRWVGQKHWYATDSEINELAKDKTRAHLRGEFLKESILVEINHANGNKILLEVFEYPIVKNDAVVGLQGVAHDITERKNAEQTIQKYREHLEELVETRTEELDHLNADLRAQLQKEKELEMMLRQSLDKEKELNELKTRFISTTSHEFRTPLTSVLSSAELIQRYGKKWGEEKQNEYFDKIKKSVDYLTKLLDDVLTISRTESGKILFNPDMVDLYKLCTEVIEEIKSNGNERNNFVFNYSMKKIKYSLDPKLIKFILTNLLSNAFKYSPEGCKVELSIASIKDWIRISVADEGIGIPDDDMSHLFVPFHRGTNTAEIPGTGLGLSIVKQAVDLHKGKITVQSELGKGSTFTAEIPNRQR
ncbi:MAG: PAS domain S-box protein, partial [Bacteroidetes bacterium]|nr:PAS domain S-box protein [Bacteroidota bacterium]